MRTSLHLAVRSLRWFYGRSLTIVLCLALTLWLPLSVRLVLMQFQADITERATNTPLVVGANGSRIDLALHALYFEAVPPGTTTMGEVERINASGLGTAIPLHCRYRTQSRNQVSGVPIVGTSPEYFEYRGLKIAAGEQLAVLGDCVIGAGVAEAMQLQVGDRILSAPQNAFNLAGDYPLKMTITGILAPSYSPDDQAVFVDTKTTWIIDGIGHGHTDVTQLDDKSLLLAEDKRSVTASAAVLPYTEITADNIDSFHFHGDPDTYPLTAIVIAPSGEKGQTLLLGRYSQVNSATICIKPPEVVQDLLKIVFRIESLIRFGSLVTGIVTAMLIGLVVFLSIRLRAAELHTISQLGGSRFTVASYLATEIGLQLITATALAVSGAIATQLLIAESLQQLLF